MISLYYPTPKDYEHRMKIVSAVDELMKRCDFESASIKQICEQAGISRSTFYRHFEDKYAIVQWHSDLIASTGILRIGRTLSWQEGLMFTMHGHREFGHLYIKASHARGYNSLSKHAERTRRNNLIETVTKYHGMALTAELDIEITATAISETTIVMRWMKDGMKESPATMAGLIPKIVPQELFLLLDDSGKQSANA